MKLRKTSLLCLLLAFVLLLSACTPAQTHTTPPTETEPPSESNSSDSSEDRDEPEIPEEAYGFYEPFDADTEGIGTLCDIAPYKDGYLLLTHTGLYTLDKDLKNRRPADEALSAPFQTEDGDFFDRLRLDPDYETPCFSNLKVTSQGVFYFCKPNNTLYLNGVALEKRANCELEDLVACGDSYYAIWNCGATNKLCFGEREVESVGLHTLRFVWLDGALYCHKFYKYEQYFVYEENVNFGFEKLNADGTLEKVSSATWGNISETLPVGDGTFYLSDYYGMMRANDEKVEYLGCTALDDRAVLRRLVLDEEHLLVLCENGELGRATPEVKESITRTELKILTYIPPEELKRSDLKAYVDFFNSLGNGVTLEYEVVCDAQEYMEKARSGEYDLLYGMSWFLLRELAKDGRLAAINDLSSDLCADGAFAPSVTRWLDCDGTRYIVPVEAGFVYPALAYVGRPEGADNTEQLIGGALSVENFFGLAKKYVKARPYSTKEIFNMVMQQLWDIGIEPFGKDQATSEEFLSSFLQLLSAYPEPSVQTELYVGTENVESLAAQFMGLSPTYLSEQGHENITLQLHSFVAVSSDCEKTDAAALALEFLAMNAVEDYMELCRNNLAMHFNGAYLPKLEKIVRSKLATDFYGPLTDEGTTALLNAVKNPSAVPYDDGLVKKLWEITYNYIYADYLKAQGNAADALTKEEAVRLMRQIISSRID